VLTPHHPPLRTPLSTFTSRVWICLCGQVDAPPAVVYDSIYLSRQVLSAEHWSVQSRGPVALASQLMLNPVFSQGEYNPYLGYDSVLCFLFAVKREKGISCILVVSCLLAI